MSFRRKLSRLFRRRQHDAAMAEEMQLHLELQRDRLIATGLSPREAELEARRRFGGLEQLKEQCREQRSWLWFEYLQQDARFAWRGLARAPGFTAVALLTLAIGIGATTAIYSVVHGVLLDPYPYAKSNEIWAPTVTGTKTNQWVNLQVSDYLELAKLPGVASAMATSPGMAVLSGDVNPENITAIRVSSSAFGFLEVPPVLGRGITAADYESSGVPKPVTVLSYKLWQRLFNGDPGALGRKLVIDDQPHVIIGVMPPRFGWFTNDGLWLPLSPLERDRFALPILRLKPGVSSAAVAEQVRARLLAQAHVTPDRFPKNGMSVALRNYLDVTVASGDMRTSLLVLLCAVGFLLLIVCSNVANLQLARGIGRNREMALRLAIGAQRGRLVRQLLTESLLLSLAGGALGVLLAFGLLEVIERVLPPYYVPNEARITPNLAVLAFSVGLTVLTGVLSGLLPSWQCTRPDVNDALKDGGQSSAGTSRQRNRARSVLIVSQVALSVVLLVGATLTVHAFINLRFAERGFNTDRMLVLQVPLHEKRYGTYERRVAFTRDLLQRVRSLPGVVGASAAVPPGIEFQSKAVIGGEANGTATVALNLIDEDYLKVLKIPLKAGRALTAADVQHGAPVALISEAATKLWASGINPIGRTISLEALAKPDNGDLLPTGAPKEVTVVGIIADTHMLGPQKPAPEAVFVPTTLRARRHLNIMVHTAGRPEAVLNDLRMALRATDKEQTMLRPLTFDEVAAEEVQQPRFNLTLLSALAVLALGLAASGIYSVLSYSVAQRRREIGVRMALGADRSAVLQLVLRMGGRLLLVGLVIGTAMSVGLGRVLASKLPDVPAFDGWAFAGAIALLSGAALVASYLPALRATRVDPIVALRAD